MSSVVVLGATGALGRVMCRSFAEEGWEVFPAARRGLPDYGSTLREIDLNRPETIAAAIAGGDVVVNTVPHEGLIAERLVLERGGLLLNVAAPSRAARLRLMQARPKTPSGLVVLNVGCVPGLTNLVAAELLRLHPSSDTLEIVITFVASGTSGTAAREWVHKYLTAVAHHRVFTAPLAEPYGTRRCLQIAEDEQGWLAEIPQTLDVRVAACFLERSMDRGLRALNAMHVLSRLPRTLFTSPPPVLSRGRRGDEATRDPIRYWTAVYESGERIGARSIEGQGDYLMTGAATLATAEALLHHADARASRGLCSVEEVLNLDAVAAGLSTRHVSILARS